MFPSHPLKILSKNWKSVLVAGLIGALCTLTLSLVFPLEYRADASVYIISKSRYGVDPYTVVKSAERVGENITQVMKTQDFFDKVVAKAGNNLDMSRFQNVSDRTKLKRWERSVDGSVVFGTGVLNISVYNKNVAQAKILANAVLDTLVFDGYEYVGGDVTIKVINKAIVTRFPVRPNLPINGILGFVIGGLIWGVVVVKRKLFS